MNRTRSHSPHVLILAGCLGLSHHVSASADTLPHLWSQRFGDASDQYGSSVTTDAGGSVIVTGGFEGTVNFGGGDLTSAGLYDIFVAKFNSAGVHQWSQSVGDATDQLSLSVAADGSGNVIVTGGFEGTVNFGGGDLTSAGGNDIFVAKFNSAGVHQWSQRAGDATNQLSLSVATDGSGNVIVTGSFSGTVNFGGGNLTSAGGYDIFVAKFNSAGVHQWSQRFGDAFTNQIGESVRTDGSGNVVVTGDFFGTVNFGGGNLVSAGSNDIFVAKFNSAGVHQWSQRFGDVPLQYGYSVATDGSGNVVVTGFFYGTVNFGGGDLIDAGGGDFFVAKFNSAGVHQWSRRFGDADYQTGESVATDAGGNVIVTGYFQGTVNFGGGDLTSAGLYDIFLAKFNSAGVYQCSRRFGDADYQTGESVATDAGGNVIVTGDFQGTVNFGDGDLTSSGNYDIFLAKFRPLTDEPMITSVVDVGNDQGRKVMIRFDRSAMDDESVATPVEQYEAYLRSDPTPSVPAPSAPGTPQIPGWTFVGAAPAHGESEYALFAPTFADSTAAFGQYYSVFFIRAATAVPTTFYDSPPDSGYSLDNLAPGAPTSFAYSAGQLSWDASDDDDFDYFSVYGSNTNSFASATLIDYTVSPALDVTASPYEFYFATATDFSGNEGAPAVVNTLSGVGDTPKRYVLSISSYPNPFNPETTIRYTVPSKGRVTIAIYDARGAHVATLVDEDRNAGAYTSPWDGTGASGARVGSGVYFARVTHPSGTRSYKMVLLK